MVDGADIPDTSSLAKRNVADEAAAGLTSSLKGRYWPIVASRYRQQWAFLCDHDCDASRSSPMQSVGQFGCKRVVNWSVIRTSGFFLVDEVA